MAEVFLKAENELLIAVFHIMIGTCPLGQVPFFVFRRRLPTIVEQKCCKKCDILRYYLVVQHYSSIFVAEFATLIAVLCCTK